jgi:hypothetical protein
LADWAKYIVRLKEQKMFRKNTNFSIWWQSTKWKTIKQLQLPCKDKTGRDSASLKSNRNDKQMNIATQYIPT